MLTLASFLQLANKYLLISNRNSSNPLLTYNRHGRFHSFYWAALQSHMTGGQEKMEPVNQEGQKYREH